MQYYEIIDTIIAELKADPRIELLTCELRRSTTDREDLRYDCEEYGVQLSEELLQLHEQIHLADIEWRLPMMALEAFENDESLYLTGRIDIRPYWVSLNGPNEENWRNFLWFDSDDDELKEDLKNYCPIDIFDPDDSGCVCVMKSAGHVSENLTLLGTESGLQNTSWTVTQYFERLIKTRGMAKWPWILSSEIESERERLEFYLAQIFGEKCGL